MREHVASALYLTCQADSVPSSVQQLSHQTSHQVLLMLVCMPWCGLQACVLH